VNGERTGAVLTAGRRLAALQVLIAGATLAVTFDSNDS
jgi:hypothetical protein